MPLNYSVVNPNNYDKTTTLNHFLLMEELPLSTEPKNFKFSGTDSGTWIFDGMTIYSDDNEYGAKVNAYMVPVDADIVLYVKRSPLDRNCPKHVVFNMFRSMNDFYDIFCIIRYLEDRRNDYLEDLIANGKELPAEYDCNPFFNIYSNRCAVIHAHPEYRQARPNHIISELLTRDFLGVSADYYIENHEKFTAMSKGYLNREEFNMELVNWINHNIYDLANIGFYMSNFPDVIHFAAYHVDGGDNLPRGIKVPKPVNRPSVSESLESVKENAMEGTKRKMDGMASSPLLNAFIKTLPALVVLLVLHVMGRNWTSFSFLPILQVVLYLFGSTLLVAIIYLLIFLIYYATHRN